MEAVVLLGAPGAGKGTVAEVVKEATSYVHVSTGDMLREAISQGRPVGLEAKTYMEAGELVPDAVIMQLVADRLESGPADAQYMFDGFPRTLEQARLMDEALAGQGADLRRVFLLDAPRDVLVGRLAGRRICRDCGAVYHVINIPPKTEGICDACGGALYQRPDDSEATVLNRLDVYQEQTASLVDYYETKNLLARVNAAQDKEHTAQEILDVLGG